MQETSGLLSKISHHDKFSITVNENCTVKLPQEVLEKLLKPHRLAHYCFVFLDEGSEIYKIDKQEVTITGGQLIFGLPNQIFVNPVKSGAAPNYKIAFNDDTLALLPNSFAFLLNPLQSNVITFVPDAKERIKSVLSNLFKLLHGPHKVKETEIILAHLNVFLTELNSAYFGHGNTVNISGERLSRYTTFKLAVEKNLTTQHDVRTIAREMAVTTNSLYSVVKEFSGVSPKEWITARVIQEAQRRLQYSELSVKELAYELGYNDPDYFSRVFKKTTGKSITSYIADTHDLYSN